MRVLIVEDQTMLRESLGSAIDAEPDMEVASMIGDASDAAGQIESGDVDLVLMDVCTENDSSGIVAARRVKEESPDVKVVIMTGMPDVTFVRQAKEAGVDSFIYKNVGTGELLSVLRSTAMGYSTFPGKHPLGAYSEFASLSDEEVEIVKLVCESKSKQEIAKELLISEGTLKRRINEILAKTGYSSILKLAVQAVSAGYIVPGIK